MTIACLASSTLVVDEQVFLSPSYGERDQHLVRRIQFPPKPNTLPHRQIAQHYHATSNSTVLISMSVFACLATTQRGLFINVVSRIESPSLPPTQLLKNSSNTMHQRADAPHDAAHHLALDPATARTVA